MSEGKQHQEIVKADPQYRRRILTAYLIGIAVLFVFFRYAFPQMISAFRRLDLHTSFIIGEIISIVFLLLFIFPSLYLINVGNNIRKHGQVPYSGMKVLRDTKIRTGKRAAFQANVLVWLGHTAIVLAIAGSIAMHFLFAEVWHSPILRNLPLF